MRVPGVRGDDLPGVLWVRRAEARVLEEAAPQPPAAQTTGRSERARHSVLRDYRPIGDRPPAAWDRSEPGY